MLGGHTAIAAHVQVPALFGGDDADALAPRLAALPRAAGDAELDLVRRTQAAIPQFQVDGQLHRILLAVAAPVAAHTALDLAQCLAIGLAGFHAAVDQPLPDLRQLVHPGAEHVDPLAAGDLRVKPEILCDLTDQDHVLVFDFTP